MDSGNERLCALVESRMEEFHLADQIVLKEIVRRLRFADGWGEQVVMRMETITNLSTSYDRTIRYCAELVHQIEDLQEKNRELHVRYDLKDSGCGAVLWDGQNEFCISALQLAEMLEARRDGRMMILPKEGENGTEN